MGFSDFGSDFVYKNELKNATLMSSRKSRLEFSDFLSYHLLVASSFTLMGKVEGDHINPKSPVQWGYVDPL